MIRRIAYLIGFTLAVLFSTYYILAFQDYKSKSKVPVQLPSFQLFADDMFWNKFGYVTAEGTWIFDNGEKANPLSTSKIDCVKSEKVCRDSTAIVSGLGITSPPFLNVDKTTYKILKWDEAQIIYADTDPTCVYYLYTINRITKEVSGVRKPKENADQKACENVEKKDFQLRLVDGYKVYSQEVDKTFSLTWVWSGLAAAFIFWLAGLVLIWRKTK